MVKLNIERLHHMLLSQEKFYEHEITPLPEVGALVKWLLHSIPPQLRDLTRRMFAWLLWALRPLTIAELSTALCIGRDVPPVIGLQMSAGNASSNSLQVSVAELTRGLAVVQSNGMISFLHGTVRDYLISDHCMDSDGHWLADYQKSEELLALTCLSCFKLQLHSMNKGLQEWTSQASPRSDAADPGFLDYASTYWMQHCRLSEAGSYYVVGAVQEYLQQYLGNQTSFQWIRCEHRNSSNSPDLRNGMLRESARYGFTELGTMYVEMGADIDQQDHPSGVPPLLLALNNQHWSMARRLIERGAAIDYGIGIDQASMLHHASACGRNDIAAFLLRYVVSTSMSLTKIHFRDRCIILLKASLMKVRPGVA